MGATGITCYLAGWSKLVVWWLEGEWMCESGQNCKLWPLVDLLKPKTAQWVLSENLHIRISSVQMQQINCRLQTVSDTWHGPGPGHRRDTSHHSLLCACAARSMQFTCDWKYLLERMGCSQQQQQMEHNQHHSESTACSSPLSPGYVPGIIGPQWVRPVSCKMCRQ